MQIRCWYFFRHIYKTLFQENHLVYLNAWTGSLGGMVPGCFSFDTLNQLGHWVEHRDMVQGSRLPADQSPKRVPFKKSYKEVRLVVFTVQKETKWITRSSFLQIFFRFHPQKHVFHDSTESVNVISCPSVFEKIWVNKAGRWMQRM